MQNNILQQIKTILTQKDNFIILVHSKPDGDALGSAYALLLYLIKQGKKAIIGLEEDFVYKYKGFINKSDLEKYFVFYRDIKNFNTFENIFILDCSTPKLLGMYQDFVIQNAQKVVVIDHHATSQTISPLQYVNSKASSASEIIFDLLKGEELTFEMAQALYMGIVFDTGQFRHSNTTADVFKKIAFLVEHFPISLESVYYMLFENETIERKKVISKLTDTIEFYNNGKVAVAYLTLNLIKDLQTQGVALSEDDLIDLIGVPHSVKGVLVSCIMREKEDQITFSFRSRTNFNVASLAGIFGGGGHEKAAGLKMPKHSVKEIKETVIKTLVEEFEKWEQQES